MPDTAFTVVADDLDTIRRALSAESDLSPHLARFLAACGGTVRGHVTARHLARDDRPRETTP